jgi:hypothetical protein
MISPTLGRTQGQVRPGGPEPERCWRTVRSLLDIVLETDAGSALLLVECQRVEVGADTGRSGQVKHHPAEGDGIVSVPDEVRGGDVGAVRGLDEGAEDVLVVTTSFRSCWL